MSTTLRGSFRRTVRTYLMTGLVATISLLAVSVGGSTEVGSPTYLAIEDDHTYKGHTQHDHPQGDPVQRGVSKQGVSERGDIALMAHHRAIPPVRARVGSSRGAQVVRFAARQAGDPYRYGATGPNAFDCSGLTSYVYRHATTKSLPRTSRQQRAATSRITRRALRPGDLVFFHGSSGVYHVGIYAGRNSIWHAPYTGAKVRKERIWSNAISFGRVR